jgi:hypothetical protein
MGSGKEMSYTRSSLAQMGTSPFELKINLIDAFIRPDVYITFPKFINPDER